jgi:hypothetical protein
MMHHGFLQCFVIYSYQIQPGAFVVNALHIQRLLIILSLRELTTQTDGAIVSVAKSEDIVFVFAELVLIGSFDTLGIHEVYLIISY